jgi:hypothetical protein
MYVEVEARVGRMEVRLLESPPFPSPRVEVGLDTGCMVATWRVVHKEAIRRWRR